ncbi:MAG: sulfotransferase family 2 domain-containing protein [Pseudomonadota bacterium]
MISHKYRCIFVHIPKTGGTSIEDIIWPERELRSERDLWMGFVDKYNNKYQTGGLQHLLASHIESEVGTNVFDNYFKFSIVRNPWDKAVSQFAFMSRRKDLMDYIGMKHDDCFKRYLELISKKKHVQWEPQVSFVLDDNGECMVDYIGRLELFTQSVTVIMSRLGLDAAVIPHSNKGQRSAYQDYYDTEAKEFVHAMYADDVKTFGYDYAQQCVLSDVPAVLRKRSIR